MYTEEKINMPAYSPADFHKVQAGIADVLADLKQISPAMSEDQRQMVFLMLNKAGTNPGSIGYTDGSVIQYDVDQVSSQYALVQKLRAMVLDPANNFHERTDAKGLSALINAINGTISLFLRNQEKIDHLKEMRDMREAMIYALRNLEPEVQSDFFKRLEEIKNGSQ